MNIETIRQKYLEAIEPRIIKAQRFADDPMFDEFLKIGSRMYDYFYPIGYHSDDFDSKVNLFTHLHYCEIDDGELSIVATVLASPNPTLDILNKINPNKKYNDQLFRKDVIVMHGCRYELIFEDISKWATYHNSDDIKPSLIEYYAATFNFEVMKFLADIQPRFDEISKKSNIEDISFEEEMKLFNERKSLENIIFDYVKSREKVFTWIKK